MQEIADQYADDRRTAFEEPSDAPVEMPEEKVLAEDAVIVYTRGGYLKRLSPLQLKRMPLPVPEENYDDSPRFRLDATTADTVYFFTDHGNCYPLAVSRLTEFKPKDRGQLLSGVLAEIEEGENLLLMLAASSAEMEKLPNLLFVTAQGMVKCSAAADYAIRSRKYPALSLKKGDRLMQVIQAASDQDLLLISREGLCIRFSLDAVPVQGRISAGVKGMNLEAGDEIVWAGQLQEKDEIVLFSDRGWGKRVPQMDFETQNRAGKGVRCFHFNKNGSNGRALTGICKTRQDTPSLLLIAQVRSPRTVLSKDEILLQGKTGKGMPYIMAILDDIITGITGVEQKSEPTENE